MKDGRGYVFESRRLTSIERYGRVKGELEKLKQSLRTDFGETSGNPGSTCEKSSAPGRKITNFFERFTVLRYESIPEGVQRDHLILRGFLEGIRRTQVRLDIRKTLWDAAMNIERLRETAIHLEAVT